MSRSTNPPDAVAGFSMPTIEDRREWGREGARRRWGDTPRLIRLDSLTADQRRLVLAFVEMAKATVPVGETSGTVEAEVRRGSVERSAA